MPGTAQCRAPSMWRQHHACPRGSPSCVSSVCPQVGQTSPPAGKDSEAGTWWVTVETNRAARQIKKEKKKGKTRRGRKGGKHLPGRGRSVYDATHSHRLQGPISWESLKWMALGANGKQAFLSLLSHLTISRGPWHCADRLARRATGNPLSLFRHSPPTDPEVASHRFLGTANTVWTPAKTGDVFWVPLYKHIYTICLWHWQVDTMIHYSYCILNIDSWKILSPGESQDTGQGAQGDGSGSLFLRFYSLSNKILIMMNMFLKASHTVD